MKKPLTLLWVITCFIIIVSGVAICVGPEEQKTETQWTGYEVSVAIGDQYFKNVGWLEGIELGLREDGVVVWRETDQTTNAH